MKRFKDRLGREWALDLTVGDLPAIKDALGVDLGQALRTGEGMAEFLFADPSALVRVLWVLAEQQATAKDVSPESFARGFDGPALERASDTLMGAVADFFPRSRIGRAIQENLPGMLREMEDAAISQISKASAGSSPGSPASTLGHSQCDSLSGPRTADG